MNIDKEVIKLAKIARDACYKFAMSEDAWDYDFHRDKSLACMCAIASFVLKDILKENGYSCKVLHGYYEDEFNDHCWVRYKDYNIDITATQFNISKSVYITKKTNKFYVANITYKTFKELSDWPKSQQPSRKVVNMIKKLIKENG